MRIYGDVWVYKSDKTSVSGTMMFISNFEDGYRGIYRLDKNNKVIMLFYDAKGNQIVDDSTEYFLDYDVCENMGIRKCIMSSIMHLPNREYLYKVISDVLTNRALASMDEERKAIERVLNNFLGELELEATEDMYTSPREIARKIVLDIAVLCQNVHTLIINKKLRALLEDEKTSTEEYANYFMNEHGIRIDPNICYDMLDNKKNLTDSFSDACYIIVKEI